MVVSWAVNAEGGGLGVYWEGQEGQPACLLNKCENTGGPI